MENNKQNINDNKKENLDKKVSNDNIEKSNNIFNDLDISIKDYDIVDIKKFFSENEKTLGTLSDEIISKINNLINFKNELVKINKNLADKKSNAEEKERQLMQKEFSIFSNESELKIKAAALLEKEKLLKDKEEKLLKKDEELAIREADALSGFIAKQKEAAEKTKQEIAALEKQKTALEKEYNDRIKALDDIEASRKKELDDKERLLMEEKSKINQDKLDIQKEREAIKEKEEELENSNQLIKNKKSYYDNSLAALESHIEQRVREISDGIINGKDNEIKILNEKIDEIYKDYNRIKAERNDYINEDKRSGGKDKKQLNNEIAQLEQELKNTKEELNNIPKDYQEIREKAELVPQLEKEIDTLREALNDMKKQEFSYKYYAVQAAQIQNELDLKTFRCSELEATIAECREKLEIIKNKYEHTEEMQKRESDIKNSKAFDAKAYMNDEPEEIKWVLDIYNKCLASKIIFEKRLLFAFHTALKSAYMAPLTILSGVSGTGKSELPKLYSRFGGLYFISLPVQPDWDSPQSLFGYFNSLDGKFNSTELLRAMVQFAANNDSDNAKDFKDSILLVLLDEMNLAHVELYFSDLLSKLESKRGSGKDEYIDVDLGSGYSYKLAVGENIIWTGTMNEDETTKALSDKVIDRGYQINFPIPETLFSRSSFELSSENDSLRYGVWLKWKTQNYIEDKSDELTRVLFESYKNIVNDIKSCLQGTGRGLGHRVWQAIEMYMRSHPINYHYYINCINNKLSEDSKKLFKESLDLSFEEALVYKVMPKLRGLELESDITLEALNKIKTLLNDNVPGLTEDYNIAMSTPDGQFIWRSANYLSKNREFYNIK